jgi:hypothetical protein
MRCPALTRLVLPLLATGWSGVFLFEALHRWRFERICAMTCGPFWDAGTVEVIRAAMDWHTPLALAALPLALWGALQAARAWARHAQTQST